MAQHEHHEPDRGISRSTRASIGFLAVAAGVFCPLTISPEIAALAMSGGSLLVAINALLFKRVQLAGIE